MHERNVNVVLYLLKFSRFPSRTAKTLSPICLPIARLYKNNFLFFTLQIFFCLCGCDYYSPANNALLINIWLVLTDVKVFQIWVWYSYIILTPVICKSLKIAIIVVLPLFFQMDNGPYLLCFMVHNNVKISSNKQRY